MLLLVISGILWFAMRRGTPIEVIGELPTKDVAEIKSLVHRKMRQQIFSGFSWSSIKRLPSAIREYSTYEIVRIKVYPDKHVWVFVRRGSKKQMLLNGRYDLEKGTNGWQMVPERYDDIGIF
ncbi:MAG: hypothetical protein JWQ71_3083 [Pedosphaera sp.]|nr:hypothetical protein [Pedosphaera sp.]